MEKRSKGGKAWLYSRTSCVDRRPAEGYFDSGLQAECQPCEVVTKEKNIVVGGVSKSLPGVIS